MRYKHYEMSMQAYKDHSNFANLGLRKLYVFQ